MLQPPLDWPHYGIGFRGAIMRGFKNYATYPPQYPPGPYPPGPYPPGPTLE
jgi:hypothetical protein